MLIRALELSVVSRGALLLGNMEGRALPRGFQRRGKQFFVWLKFL
jgi:hypothetical protein